jgi:hypothetical protein
VQQPPFVDDPVARGDVPVGRRLVSPVADSGDGELRWEDVAHEEPGLDTWCAERWLASYRRLRPPPPGYAATRDALHLLAEHVISPTRQRDHGEITLRWTLGGFGTPFFGADAQLRVEGDVFVVQTRERVQRGRLTNLGDAAEFVGFDLTRTDAAEQRRPLPVDAEASRFLGDVYGFAFSVLEELRAEAGAGREPSAVNLWPEHFDVAVELGRGSGRAGFGVSPGDEHDPDPYVYVSREQRDGFEALPWADIVAADDQRSCALAFLRARLD